LARSHRRRPRTLTSIIFPNRPTKSDDSQNSNAVWSIRNFRQQHRPRTTNNHTKNPFLPPSRNGFFSSKISPQKHPLKYNNPLPTLNILYSNLQATFTLPPHTPLKYNKPPHPAQKKQHQNHI
jgi:hypothetical protein